MLKIPCLPPFTVTAQVQILAETKDYNHSLMNIPAVWARTMGKRAKVAVLDTGVPNHLDLSPEAGKSFVPEYYQDFQGHATHCAGILAATAFNGMGVMGIAPECSDYYLTVLDRQGQGNVDDIVKGIYWATDVMGVHIISMSLGIPAGYPIFPALEKACNYAVANGVTIFAAAGNEFGAVAQPARYDSVIAVGAVDQNRRHAKFSNTGNQVQFAAGGVDTYSTWLNNSYAKLTGSSMACPAVAAAAALIQSDHLATSDTPLVSSEIHDKLVKIAVNPNDNPFDTKVGYGIPIFQPSKIVEQPQVKRKSFCRRFWGWTRSIF
jgi:subtilisin family serine protease